MNSTRLPTPHPAAPEPVEGLAAQAPPLTALKAALGRMRSHGLRTVAFVVAMCVGMALLLTAMEGGRFLSKLVYSLSIGAVCTAVHDLSRLSQAWFSDRLRRARGLPVDAAGFGSGWRGVVPAAILAMAVGPIVGLWVGDRLTGYSSPSLLSMDSSNTRITLVLSVLGTVMAVAVLSTLERLSRARAQAEAAQRLAAETRLRLLQSQLEPHMLFNTLANLRVLIGLDPQRAQAMLDRLIAFLRATLDASRTAHFTLATEFEHCADYLALMAVRMGPRLTVRLDLPSELSGQAVPPLLLQPLVENAIKHGLEPKIEGGRIEVSARLDQGALRLAVRDTGVGLGPAALRQGAPASGSSFGLEQVRARLTTLYGARARFSLESVADGEGGVCACLWIPLPASARPAGIGP
jgi:signal transduction histidine kinase